MVTVFVPTMLLTLTGGVKQVDIEASNIRQVIDRLDAAFPGIKERLVDQGQIRSNLAVSINGEIARLGLMEKVEAGSEVHFVPAIAGGTFLRIGFPQLQSDIDCPNPGTYNIPSLVEAAPNSAASYFVYWHAIPPTGCRSSAT